MWRILMSEPCDLLVITALKDELDAVRNLEERGREGWTTAHDRDGFPYHTRTVEANNRAQIGVAVAWSGEMGETAAAVSAQALIDYLRPTCLAMCGICAGRRGSVALGDIIVASSVY